MIDFRNLPNVTTTAVDEEADRYIVEARASEPKAQTCRPFYPVPESGTFNLTKGLPSDGPGINLGVDLGKLREVFGEAPEFFYQGPTAKLARGLSTLHLVFDEVA